MSNINKDFVDCDGSGYSSGGSKKKRTTKTDTRKDKRATDGLQNGSTESGRLYATHKKPSYKKLSDGEITEYLKDSILIPPEEWAKLAVGSNISYYKKDNNFIKSGFIKNIYTKDDTTTGSSNVFILYGTKLNTYNNDKYYKEFTVNTSNIKELYKKIDQSAILEYKIIKKNIANSMNTFLEKFNQIENELNSINDKILKLENNHIKTINFIKKLHNIKSIDDIKNI